MMRTCDLLFGNFDIGNWAYKQENRWWTIWGIGFKMIWPHWACDPINMIPAAAIIFRQTKNYWRHKVKQPGALSQELMTLFRNKHGHHWDLQQKMDQMRSLDVVFNTSQSTRPKQSSSNFCGTFCRISAHLLGSHEGSHGCEECAGFDRPLGVAPMTGWPDGLFMKHEWIWYHRSL